MKNTYLIPPFILIIGSSINTTSTCPNLLTIRLISNNLITLIFSLLQQLLSRHKMLDMVLSNGRQCPFIGIAVTCKCKSREVSIIWCEAACINLKKLELCLIFFLEIILLFFCKLIFTHPWQDVDHPFLLLRCTNHDQIECLLYLFSCSTLQILISK